MFFHKYHDRIVTDPAILVGKPVIKGTRIPVELILKLLAQGTPEKEILDEYPRLTRDDIRAAMEYAHDAVHTEEIHDLQPA